MKKWICAVLAALMLMTAAALAEGDVLVFASADTEVKLEQMIPVLDSLAVSLNVGSDDNAFQVTYNAEDAQLIWSDLWQLSANWLSKEVEYQVPGGLSIPADVLEACAKASFGTRVNPLPAIPNNTGAGTVIYDPAADAYRITLGESDGHYIVIESYANDGAALVSNCGLYDGVTEQRQGGLTVRMEEAGEDARYPYSVIDAHAEYQDDFNGLWATLCSIRYVEPEAAATPVPTSTPEPFVEEDDDEAVTEDYRTLSSGSRGEDVRALQRRLNDLGYNSGSADGVFGSGTRQAVIYFQEAIGKNQDGVATPEVQRRLFAASAPEYDRYITLSKGASGVRVENLQDRLRELGYTAAPADGSYGDRLVSAVKRFQRAAGLKADGIAGKATLNAVEKRSAPYCDSYIDLQKGDSGHRVSEMQNRLNELGYFDHKTNGKYDSNTVDAVAAFKSDYGLRGNGKSVDASVVEMMFDDLEPADTDDDDVIEEDDDYVEDDDEEGGKKPVVVEDDDDEGGKKPVVVEDDDDEGGKKPVVIEDDDTDDTDPVETDDDEDDYVETDDDGEGDDYVEEDDYIEDEDEN